MSAETSERERDTLQPGDYVLMRKLTGVKPTLARLRKGATITVDNLTFKADPLLGKKFGVCTAQNGLLGPEPTDVAKELSKTRELSRGGREKSSQFGERKGPAKEGK
uniref:CDC48_N domain-containing protein n=1 Tax=Bursaphelenchus xylophilus TaxID=6326 RepID=A0A1I7SFW1_BURXY